MRLPHTAALGLGLAVWLIGVPLAHAALPWAISLLAARHGWVEGSPGTWNFVGLLPLGAGAALLLWVMVLHFARAPESVELEWTPKYLLTRGPYRSTRNPMYVAEVLLWLGWALFFGSVAVLAGAIVLAALAHWIAVPREERALEARFGASYLEYKNAAPRWLRRPRA